MRRKTRTVFCNIIMQDPERRLKFRDQKCTLHRTMGGRTRVSELFGGAPRMIRVADGPLRTRRDGREFLNETPSVFFEPDFGRRWTWAFSRPRFPRQHRTYERTGNDMNKRSKMSSYLFVYPGRRGRFALVYLWYVYYNVYARRRVIE